ncbi:PQQ-binding-like beta-propeller repeat protein [Chryseolinea sp. T2]|uniref:outer membrane protein assembly factor BamB family protein n=1 Tax=Chryseolinea sp. T2 TaxID=3129255 RepID=UPI003077E2CC
MKISRLLLVLAAACLMCCRTEKANDPNSWPTFGHDATNNKFSALSKIDTSNVSQLKEAWRFEDSAEGGGLYFNPVMMKNRVIGLMPSNKLVALDAGTGKLLWEFEPDTSSIPNWSRGITYHPGNPDRILLVSGGTLYSINAENGSLISDFGKNGRVDFYEGLEVPDSMRTRVPVSTNAPGVVFNNELFIVGCKVPDELPSIAGDIRAFNINTGKLAWVFHVIPKPGEYGADTWGSDPRSRNGGANCWAGMALDEKRGIVFVPTASPSFDFYGADRPGQNLFANCLLALNAKTGERIWHYQTTHHDLWDRDNGSPPNLVTVKRDGKDVDAVALVTKMGYLFLFDRETGKSLFEVNEVPVDTVSRMPGEKPWPTQPLPANPPFARQGYREELFGRSSQWIKDEITKNKYKTGIYEPPSIDGSIILPTAHGGSNWGGAAVNPATNLLFVNATDMPWILKLTDLKQIRAANQRNPEVLFRTYCSSCHGMDKKGSGVGPDLTTRVQKYRNAQIASILEKGAPPMPSFKFLSKEQIAAIIAYVKDTVATQSFETAAIPENNEPYGFNGYNFYLDPEGHPAIAPPYGTLTSIDLNTGDIVWQVPLGEDPRLKKLGISNSGMFNRGGCIATAGGLIFIASTGDNMFRAFDQNTGKILWEQKLPGMASSIPSTYAIGDRQYVVLSVNAEPDNNFKGGYIAFALPR